MKQFEMLEGILNPLLLLKVVAFFHGLHLVVCHLGGLDATEVIYRR
jgi:hypothetical protein